MQAINDLIPASDSAAADGFLTLLEAAVDEAVAGVLVVDGRDGRHRLAYVNDSFRAQALLSGENIADLDVGDAAGLGAALDEAVSACVGADPLRRRVAYRQGGVLLDVQITVTRHVLAGQGPWFVVVVRESAETAMASDSEKDGDRLLRAAASSGAGHWDWDLVAGRVWYEPRFKELLGYRDSALDDTFAALQALIHGDERLRVLQALRLHMEQRQPFDVKLRLRRAAGDYSWYRLCGEATRDPSGRPLYISGRLEDISADIRAVDTLRRSEESLRRTLDGLSFAVGVINSDGELIEINRAWRDYSGDRALIGLRYGFGEIYARLCREAGERCAVGPIAATGVEDVLAGRAQDFLLAYRDSGADGRALEMGVLPLDVDGRRGAIVTHNDVSALEGAHAQVRTTKEFYELILDSLPLNIAYFNRRREFVYANRRYEEWLRMPIEALQGRCLEDMTTPENYRQMAPRVESALSGRTVEYLARGDRDGKSYELAVTYLPHRMEGEVVGFFSVVEDVTVQRRLEQELRHAQKLEAVGQLTGGIAHDFNNLLSVIIGNLQLLERPLKGDLRLTGHVTTALRASLRGADLTRRLLAFARQQVLEPKVLNIARLLGGTSDLIRRTLGAAIDVVCDVAPDTWSAFLDATQLESSVLNLAINARDAMPDGGRIMLVTRNVTFGEDDPERHPKLSAGDYVEISVSDTGSGMTPEVVKHAFDPFFTTKESGKGTGLGLSMVYGFAEQSGGVATLTSTLGAGTVIRMFFPRSHIPSDSAGDAEGMVDELPLGSETILIVDNDTDVRGTAAAALRMLGYTVLEAGNGSAALTTLTREPGVALLLADLILPGGVSGDQLAARALGLRPTLRVLHTSAFSQPGLRELSTAADTGLLHKPYAIGELARRVRAVLDREKGDGHSR